MRFFEENPNVTAIEVSEKEQQLTFFYTGSRDEQIMLLQQAFAKGFRIYSATEVEKDLEDVFMAITKEAQANATETI